MAALEVIALDTSVPQLMAPQAGDTYTFPRAVEMPLGTANGVLFLNGSKVVTSGSALTFDGTNLGLGTASPGTGGTSAKWITLDANSGSAYSGGVIYRVNGTAQAFHYVDGTAFSHQTQTGITAQKFLIEGSEQMRLTSTGLGIGTSSPSQKLDVAGNVQIQNAGTLYLNNSDSTNQYYWQNIGASGANNATLILSRTNVGETLRIDSSGNLGLGVTPSAWSADGRGFQLFGNAGRASAVGAYFGAVSLMNDCFYGTANDFRYYSGGAVAKYQQAAGAHAWFTAPSGTAGNAISFTQAMTLDASGRLGIGTTSPDEVLVVKTSAGNVKSSALNSGAKWVGTNAANNAEAELGLQGNPLVFLTNGTERARITSGGDVQVSSGGSFQVGGTAARATTAGTNRVDIFDGTAPVGTLANGVSFYSASGEANVMDAAGNATLLSPHDTETNEWIFRSKHTPTGKVLRIDVERLLRFVNEHFGLDAVKEFVER
jgi:hypothetical protein